MSLQIKSIPAPTSLRDMAYEAIKESILATDVMDLNEDMRLDEIPTACEKITAETGLPAS